MKLSDRTTRARAAAAVASEQEQQREGRRPPPPAQPSRTALWTSQNRDAHIVRAASTSPAYFAGPTLELIPNAWSMEVSSLLLGIWSGNVTSRPVLKKPPALPIMTYG